MNYCQKVSTPLNKHIVKFVKYIEQVEPNEVEGLGEVIFDIYTYISS